MKISVNEVTSLAGQSLEMLSFGDRNPKGTTILPRLKAYLIVPVAANFKQFPQSLCQVALSSLSG